MLRVLSLGLRIFDFEATKSAESKEKDRLKPRIEILQLRLSKHPEKP